MRYKIDDIDSERFYQIPKILFTDQFKGLGNDARMMYALLKDRMILSRKHNWVEENGDIFLLFKQEDICEILDISLSSVTRAMRKLVEFSLIEVVRQGLSKPNKIYINRIVARQVKTSQFDESEQVNLTNQDKSIWRANDTEKKETEKSDTEKVDIESNPGAAEKPKGGAQRKTGRAKGYDYTPEFETFWAAYPRDADKYNAFQKFKARLNEGVPLEEIMIATQNYAALVRKKETPPDKILHAKTFLGPAKRYEEFVKGVELFGGVSENRISGVAETPDSGFLKSGSVDEETLQRLREEQNLGG